MTLKVLTLIICIGNILSITLIIIDIYKNGYDFNKIDLIISKLLIISLFILLLKSMNLIKNKDNFIKHLISKI